MAVRTTKPRLNIREQLASLHGIQAFRQQINQLVGVSSPIQAQLDAKASATATDALIQQTIRDSFDTKFIDYGTVVGHYTLLGNLLMFEFRAEEVFRTGSMPGLLLGQGFSFDLPVPALSTDGESVIGTILTDFAHGADFVVPSISTTSLGIIKVTGTTRTAMTNGDLLTSVGNSFYIQGSYLADLT